MAGKVCWPTLSAYEARTPKGNSTMVKAPPPYMTDAKLYDGGGDEM
jgi:hypothetical protein